MQGRSESSQLSGASLLNRGHPAWDQLPGPAAIAVLQDLDLCSLRALRLTSKGWRNRAGLHIRSLRPLPFKLTDLAHGLPVSQKVGSDEKSAYQGVSHGTAQVEKLKVQGFSPSMGERACQLLHRLPDAFPRLQQLDLSGMAVFYDWKSHGQAQRTMQSPKYPLVTLRVPIALPLSPVLETLTSALPDLVLLRLTLLFPLVKGSLEGVASCLERLPSRVTLSLFFLVPSSDSLRARIALTLGEAAAREDQSINRLAVKSLFKLAPTAFPSNNLNHLHVPTAFPNNNHLQAPAAFPSNSINHLHGYGVDEASESSEGSEGVGLREWVGHPAEEEDGVERRILAGNLRALARLPSLTELDIGDMFAKVSLAEALAPLAPQLQGLEASTAPQDFEAVAEMMAQRAPSLRYFCLLSSVWPSGGGPGNWVATMAAIAKMTALESLYLDLSCHCDPEARDQHLLEALSSLPLLSRLCLHASGRDMPVITDAVVVVAAKKTLKSVLLRDGLVGDAGVAALARCSSLSELEIQDCPGVTDAGLSHFAGHEGLAYLLLFGCNITKAIFNNLSPLPNLKQFVIRSDAITEFDPIKDRKLTFPSLFDWWLSTPLFELLPDGTRVQMELPPFEAVERKSVAKYFHFGGVGPLGRVKTPRTLTELSFHLEEERRVAFHPEVKDGLPEDPLADRFGCTECWLPEGEEWPMCACGVPQRLGAQIDLGRASAMAGAVDWGEGLLQVFLPGCAYACDPRQCAVRVIPLSGTNACGYLAHQPLDKGDLPGPFAARQVAGWRGSEELPREADLLATYDDGRFSSLTLEMIRRRCGGEHFCTAKIPTAKPGCKLGGWAVWIQDSSYPHCARCGAFMTVLVLSLDGDHCLEYPWGDMGTAQVLQCPSHKDSVALTWACG